MPSMDDSGIPANFARDWFFSDSEVALLLDFVPDFSWRRFNIFSFSRSKSSLAISPALPLLFFSFLLARAPLPVLCRLFFPGLSGDPDPRRDRPRDDRDLLLSLRCLRLSFLLSLLVLRLSPCLYLSPVFEGMSTRSLLRLSKPSITLRPRLRLRLRLG